MDSKPYKGSDGMKKVRFKGKRRAYNFAEWKDIAGLVKRHLVENKEFYAELAEL